jgi:hypothetical protein
LGIDVKIPRDRTLGAWARDLIDQCCVSRPDRISQLASWRAYYYSGSDDANEPARYNKIFSHIDRLASFLYSADDIRFSISYDGVLGEPWVERAAAAARVLNRDYHRRGCDLEFADAVHWSLIEGKNFIKTVWGHNGLEPWLVHPQFMGVLREDIDGLDRQEAFTHTSYVTPSELERQIIDHPNYAEIKRKLRSAAKRTTADEQDPLNDTLRQIVIGGMRPVQQNVAATSKSNVVIASSPVPNLDPKVANELVRIDELWVQDSARDDYTTIRVVEPDIVIEGDLRHRNLSGVPEEHPFSEVCPNRLDNYFWGQSEIATLAPLQDMLNEAIADVRRITRLQARPPKAFIGFQGLTEQKYKALNVPDGYIAEDQPNAKVERLAPEVPPELFQQIEKILNWFDEAAGFQPIMMGQGEPGVRAGSHAQTLLRTGSPRMRDRALLVERQGGAHGDFCFKLLQNKDAEVYTSKAKEQFMLKQMPGDYRLAVDSHSGSPVFADDIERKAALLSKAGAISPTDLLMLTRPPHQDILIEHAEAREKAQQQFMAQHPELMLKGKKSR